MKFKNDDPILQQKVLGKFIPWMKSLEKLAQVPNEVGQWVNPLKLGLWEVDEKFKSSSTLPISPILWVFKKSKAQFCHFKTPEKACQIELVGMVLYMQQKDLHIQDIDLMGKYGTV